MIDDALGLARRGWRVVPLHRALPDGCSCGRRPCASPGKHPIIGRGWQHTASTNPDVLRAWWREHPDANIGLATGRGSGVIVLDVDPRHGGDDALHDLELSYAVLPTTVEVVTGGGGRALLFRAPTGEIRNSAGLIGPGLDVRGEGGLAVMPPSVHASGRAYQWSVDGHPDEVEVVEAPAWLRALLAQRPAKTGRKRPAGEGRVGEGSRNATLTSMAGSLRRVGMHPSAIKVALECHNAEACDPPLPVEEVARIARSAATWPIGPPWVIDPAGFLTDDRLDVRARAVLLVLAMHANDEGLAWPGYRRIEEISGVSRRHIRPALDNLERAGRMETVLRSRHGNRYRLLYGPPRGSSGDTGVPTDPLSRGN